jgi:PIN domain nuclease of toxin-antitoxin system
MKLLLDTHALLWFLAGSPSLSTPALTAINDPANELRLSPISLLEIAIKVRINPVYGGPAARGGINLRPERHRAACASSPGSR